MGEIIELWVFLYQRGDKKRFVHGVRSSGSGSVGERLGTTWRAATRGGWVTERTQLERGVEARGGFETTRSKA